MELMLVILIIAVIMAISVPLFNNMGQGGNLRAAVAQMRSTMSLARQWAITRNTDTYVVFPHWDVSYSEATNEVDKVYRAYAVYALTDRKTLEGEFISDWTYLPLGIVFDDDEDRTGSVFRKSAGKYTFLSDVAFPFPAKNSSVHLPCFHFKPNGQLKNATYETIHLRAGWVDTSNIKDIACVLAKEDEVDAAMQVSGMTGAIKYIPDAEGK